MVKMGQITVTAAGTRVQGTSIMCPAVVIKGHPSNTGIIYVGNSTVTSSNGYPLKASEVVILEVSNLNEVWFDSTVNGEKAAFVTMKER